MGKYTNKLAIMLYIQLFTTACGGAPCTSPTGDHHEKSCAALPAARGEKGEPGIQGVPGVDAMPTTALLLCQGFVPTYPNVFPEYALCIQDKLYGVYSANGGFLALLPAGTYSSNGINASCNFTIGEHCSISY